VHPTSAYEVADYAIAAELVRHRLAATVLPISAADRFPDLRVIPLSPPLTWTLYLAPAESQLAALCGRLSTRSSATSTG
jgi:DNA-binding transcriptional LysR family regulator